MAGVPKAGAVATKPRGFWRKTNSDGKKVMTSRGKAALWGGGALALFTPIGGNLISGLSGQAMKNTERAAEGISGGVMGSMLSSPISICSCCSSVSLLIVAILGFVLMSSRSHSPI